MAGHNETSDINESRDIKVSDKRVKAKVPNDKVKVLLTGRLLSKKQKDKIEINIFYHIWMKYMKNKQLICLWPNQKFRL